MSGVEGVVTEVLRAHPDVIEYGGWNEHPCCAEAEDHNAHVAALIVQALGLTEEVSVRVGGVAGLVMSRAEAEEKPEQRHIIATRWLSSWVAVERGVS